MLVFCGWRTLCWRGSFRVCGGGEKSFQKTRASLFFSSLARRNTFVFQRVRVMVLSVLRLSCSTKPPIFSARVFQRQRQLQQRGRKLRKAGGDGLLNCVPGTTYPQISTISFSCRENEKKKRGLIFKIRHRARHQIKKKNECAYINVYPRGVLKWKSSKNCK